MHIMKKVIIIAAILVLIISSVIAGIVMDKSTRKINQKEERLMHKEGETPPVADTVTTHQPE